MPTYPISQPADNAAAYTWTQPIRDAIIGVNDHQTRISAIESGSISTGKHTIVTGTTHTDVQNAINAATAGDTLVLASDFTCTATINLNKRLHLVGAGKLNFTSGIAAAPGISVTADDCTLEDLHVINVNSLGNTTGNSNRGITFLANNGLVRGCRVENWQYGIMVDPGGEYQNHSFINNRVIVLGAGAGPNDTGGLGYGEDRGDGITTWGAIATIVGNVVTAKAGTDARIGIHTEQLAPFQTISPAPAHSDSMVTMTGNTVAGSADGTGKFRRGMVSEQVNNVTITGNVVADASWWGIALIDCTDCIAANNTVIHTRTASDNYGGSWGPTHAGIMVLTLGAGARNIVTGNTVRAVNGSAGDALIIVRNQTGGSLDNRIDNNLLSADPGSAITNGIFGDGASTRLRVVGNTVTGFTTEGITLYACDDAEIRGNVIDGVSTPTGSKGIRAEGDSVASGIMITNNTIYRVVTGIERVNTPKNIISGNLIRNVTTTGIEGFGCTNSIFTQNAITVTGTAIANVTNGTNGNVVAQNV